MMALRPLRLYRDIAGSLRRPGWCRLFLLPLFCLLCPAHLLGYLLGALGLWQYAAYLHERAHGPWAEFAGLAIGVVVVLCFWAWERRHHRQHSCKEGCGGK